MVDNVLISELPPAVALDNADLIEVEQGISPANTSGKGTLGALLAFIQANFTLADGSVTTSKIVDANVTTSKIADANVTLAKLATSAIAAIKAVLVNSQSAAYTLALTDAGGGVYHPPADTTPRTWTIPKNDTIPFPVGSAVTLDNDIGAGAVTIVIDTDTLVWIPTGATGTRTLASGGQATIWKVSTTRWRISGSGLT